MAICCLSNLFATTETVGNDQRIFTGTAHSGKQRPFTDLDRHVVVVFFKPEGSGHTTTTRKERFPNSSRFMCSNPIGNIYFHPFVYLKTGEWVNKNFSPKRALFCQTEESDCTAMI